MGSYLWSERARENHADSVARQRAYAARQRREAAEATQAAWADWNRQEARARVMQLDVTAPAEDAGWRAIGKATAALMALIEAELAEPYEDARMLDADAAGYGYRSGGADCGDNGLTAEEVGL